MMKRILVLALLLSAVSLLLGGDGRFEVEGQVRVIAGNRVYSPYKQWDWAEYNGAVGCAIVEPLEEIAEELPLVRFQPGMQIQITGIYPHQAEYRMFNQDMKEIYRQGRWQPPRGPGLYFVQISVVFSGQGKSVGNRYSFKLLAE